MKVLQLLRKAGIIRMQEDAQTVDHVVLETRSISIQVLQEQFEATRQASLSTTAPELTVPFEKVFEAMKTPSFPHGWNVEKIGELLNSPDLKNKAPEDTKKAVLDQMSANKVTQEEILQDAASRDRALDAYEEFVIKKVKDRSEQRKVEVKRLNDQIREGQKKIQELTESEEREEKDLKDWQKRKVEKEEELVKIASVFTGDHGITIGSKK